MKILLLVALFVASFAIAADLIASQLVARVDVIAAQVGR